jgi:outer membrane protein OmpA-like peptidoglycan-associated protein
MTQLMSMRLQGSLTGILAVSFLSLAAPAIAGQISREQIVNALTAWPNIPRLSGTPPLTRSLTVDDGYTVATTRPMPSIDLDVYFNFNSAAIRSEAQPQLRELGAALTDPRLKGATISIGGHTDAVGGYAFNQKLSERRAIAIKQYLVDNFQLPPANLRAVGYGKQRPKNKMDPYAPENRRVEIENLDPRVQAQH